MTTSEGGPRCPRDEQSASSPSVATPSDGAPDHRRSLQALERRLSNVIDVQDPARIIECSRLERQRNFQYLVRRYVSDGVCQRLVIHYEC